MAFLNFKELKGENPGIKKKKNKDEGLVQKHSKLQITIAVLYLHVHV